MGAKLKLRDTVAQLRDSPVALDSAAPRTTTRSNMADTHNDSASLRNALRTELLAAEDFEYGRRLVVAPDGPARWRVGWSKPDYGGPWTDCALPVGWRLEDWVAEQLPTVADALLAAIAIQADVLDDPDFARNDPAVTLPIVFTLRN